MRESRNNYKSMATLEAENGLTLLMGMGSEEAKAYLTDHFNQTNNENFQLFFNHLNELSDDEANDLLKNLIQEANSKEENPKMLPAKKEKNRALENKLAEFGVTLNEFKESMAGSFNKIEEKGRNFVKRARKNSKSFLEKIKDSPFNFHKKNKRLDEIEDDLTSSSDQDQENRFFSREGSLRVPGDELANNHLFLNQQRKNNLDNENEENKEEGTVNNTSNMT